MTIFKPAHHLWKQGKRSQASCAHDADTCTLALLIDNGHSYFFMLPAIKHCQWLLSVHITTTLHLCCCCIVSLQWNPSGTTIKPFCWQATDVPTTNSCIVPCTVLSNWRNHCYSMLGHHAGHCLQHEMHRWYDISGVQSWPFQPLFNITFSLLFVNLAVKWLKSEIKSDPKVAKKCYLEPLLLEILVKGDKK